MRVATISLVSVVCLLGVILGIHANGYGGYGGGYAYMPVGYGGGYGGGGWGNGALRKYTVFPQIKC